MVEVDRWCAGTDVPSVVDAQVHGWDGRPHNQAGPAGEQFVADLHHRHRMVDPSPSPLSADAFGLVTPDALAAHVLSAVDRAVLVPATFDDLFVLGFAAPGWHAELAEEHPGRLVLAGELDPADRARARGIGAQVTRGGMRALTVLPSRRPETAVSLRASWLRRTLIRAEQAGAGVVHVGVAPTARPPAAAPGWAYAGVVDAGDATPRPRWPSWAEPVRAGSALPVRARTAGPLPAGGIELAEVRELAAALPRVRFVLGATIAPTAALVRLARLPNVHVLLTEVLVGLRRDPVPAAEALGELLAAYGPDRLMFGSGYPLVRPARLIRDLMTFRYPEPLRGRYPELDDDVREAVLGGTAARLYGLDLPHAPRTVRRGAPRQGSR
ncbi:MULTISPECIES: amidohydrolase family protein [unclassified Pseudonocardia]|uniref:amidohydrolase family protein n=1 Tax=unclassified Pseudonocardia TaxID=2619320 RepID=UPI00094AF6D9|nr:amidohydrolase family protein [Pseudonocardia sp. Ae707_Ps1]